MSRRETVEGRIGLDVDDAELAHMLEGPGGVVDVLERRSNELVAAVILRDVIAKILRATDEQR